jgi:trehalose-6-phosphate synthase
VAASGAIWVGGGGRFTETTDKGEPFMEIETLGRSALATVDQPAREYRGFYQGFVNSALWPVLHSRSDLIRTSERRERWSAMMAVLDASSLTHWFDTYVAALKAYGGSAQASRRLHVAWPWFGRLQAEPAASPAL